MSPIRKTAELRLKQLRVPNQAVGERSSDEASRLTIVAVKHLSDHVLDQVHQEHPLVVLRVESLHEQSQRLHALTQRVDEELEDAKQMLRGIEEMLGIAPQLSIHAYSSELRGRRLREIAVEILRQQRAPGEVVHYREWYELVTHAGIRVGGKDPLATFLTQVSQAPEVESVKPRSGLYRLGMA
jgi:hypothetical protein